MIGIHQSKYPPNGLKSESHNLRAKLVDRDDPDVECIDVNCTYKQARYVLLTAFPLETVRWSLILAP